MPGSCEHDTVVASRPALPTGVVTFLLTDVVGSTSLWDEHPAEMRAALAMHDAAIADAVSANRGLVLKSRGEGDSVFCVFQRASDAVQAAYEAQLALGSTVWPENTAIRVRMSLHSGEADEVDGDYLGPTVNLAARLRSIANGGEIVLSEAVEVLVRDQLPEGTFTRPIGEVRLRGLDRPERATALAGGGLADTWVERQRDTDTSFLDERGVTARERDVLDALADRRTNAEISARFSVSVRTVESHVSSLLRKLGAADRLELSEMARELAATQAPRPLPPMLQLVSQATDLLGRTAERERLLAAWERASSGTRVMAVVTGEPGLGKSTLVASVAAEIHVSGGLVLYGACFGSADAPYAPVASALTDDLAHVTEPELRDRVGRRPDALARVVPDVGRRLGIIPPRQEAVDVTQEREEILAGIDAYLTRLAAEPTLLVIEDVHWASATTHRLLEFLARHAGGSLMILVTSRDTAPDLDADLARWLGTVARLPAVEMLPLSGLDEHDTRRLLERHGSTTDPKRAVQVTGGNPLFLSEIATAGQSSRTLQALVAERFDRLDTSAQEIVDLAVAAGDTFGIDVVAGAADVDRAEVIDALEAAADAGLVRALPERVGRYAFVHAVYRSARYEAISSGRRARLHAALTTTLLPRIDDPSMLPELARHAYLSASVGDANQAADLARKAGDHAALAADNPSAIEHFTRGLDVIDLASVPDEHLRLELTLRLGAAVTIDDPEAGRVHLHGAARHARAIDSPVGVARAACAMHGTAGELGASFADQDFVALAEEALRLLPEDETSWRPKTTALLGAHLRLTDQPERGLELGRQAEVASRHPTDPTARIIALLMLRYTLGPFELEERYETAQEAFELAQQNQRPGFAAVAAGALSWCAGQQGDLPAHRRWHEVSISFQRVPRVDQGTRTAGLHVLRGDLDAGVELAQRTFDAARRRGVGNQYGGPLLLQIEAMRGNFLTEPYRRELTRGHGFTQPSARAQLAMALARTGQESEAAELLAEIRSEGLDSIPRRAGWLTMAATLAETAQRIDDRDLSEQLLERLAPLAGQLAHEGGLAWSSIDFLRAICALTANRPDEALDLIIDAVAASRRRRTPIFLGRELVVLAETLRRLGRDPDEIQAPLAEALQIADTTGARIITQDAAFYGLTL